MKPARPLLEVLFPKVRAEVLRLLFTAPQKERYVRELARMSGLALSTVQDELRKLSAVQLVTSRSHRPRRFYRANRGHPLFPALLRIVERSRRLPATQHSALQRQQGHAHARRARRRRAAAHLTADRPAKWNLFSGVKS